MSQRTRFVYFPLFLAVALAIGIYIGSTLPFGEGSTEQGERLFGLGLGNASRSNKINEILDYVEHDYVDQVDRVRMEDEAIQHLLEELDPHSYHISAEELAALNEPLEGKFEGIGVQFMIEADTVVVISPVEGGPSEKVGVAAGDRIIEVNGETIAGNGITNKKVMNLLRGEKGSEVAIAVKRHGVKDPMDFTIVRDNIPIFSLEIAYPIQEEIGYIKLTRFAKTTYEEFIKAVDELDGMKGLVLDLRGNGGGYLDAATDIAEEFLNENDLIVYTEGRARKRQTYYAGSDGRLKDIPVVVLIDDQSASASEILAGALQDNDRGTIVGRRSFGKGLVQEQSEWADGSATRLTIARYYTPTGRCIQKPYGDSSVAKLEPFFNAIESGLQPAELDSLSFPDSLVFTTPAGKVVYGGGGILPDVRLPYDTAGYSNYYHELAYRGIIEQFAFEHIDQQRQQYDRYANADEFVRDFVVEEELVDALTVYAETRGTLPSETGLAQSRSLIDMRLKAFMGKHLFYNHGFYPVLHQQDATVQKALELLARERLAEQPAAAD